MNDEQERQPMYADELHKGAPDPKPRRKRRWIGYVAATAFIGTVLGTLVILGLKFADGPAEGTVLNADVTPLPSASASAAPSMQLLQGMYFTLKYPSIFDSVSHKPDEEVFKDQYNLSSQKDYRRYITVSVHRVDGGPDSDSDFKSRVLRGYEVTNEKLAGETVYTLINPKDGEHSIFWPHKGMLLEICATSSSTKDDLAAYIAAIKPTVRWRI